MLPDGWNVLLEGLCEWSPPANHAARMKPCKWYSFFHNIFIIQITLKQTTIHVYTNQGMQFRSSQLFSCFIQIWAFLFWFSQGCLTMKITQSKYVYIMKNPIPGFDHDLLIFLTGVFLVNNILICKTTVTLP